MKLNQLCHLLALLAAGNMLSASISHAAVPTADAGPDQALNESQLVTLDGSGSEDTDGDALTYNWVQSAGTPVVILTDNTLVKPSFMAPLISAEQDLEFSLTVTAGGQTSAASTTTVTVHNVLQPPVAAAASNTRTYEGERIDLIGSGSYDPNGLITGYTWTQTGGTSVSIDNSNSANTWFNAPFIGNETLTFQLEVTDNDNQTDTDTTVVQVITNKWGAGSEGVLGLADVIYGLQVTGGLRDTSPADNASLARTGQKSCYSATGALISCNGSGQDGDHQAGAAWPVPRFTDKGNGTVKDNLTGLIWLKNANCLDRNTWIDSLNNANLLDSGECGLTDSSQEGEWRMPNITELSSLLNYEYTSPALSNDNGNLQWWSGGGSSFTNIPTTAHWTSTTYTFLKFKVRVINMYRGEISEDFKTAKFSLWPVRDPRSPSDPRYGGFGE